MILTGIEIDKQVKLGNITIDPYDTVHLNPNSYNFHLGDTLLLYQNHVLDSRQDNPVVETKIGTYRSLPMYSWICPR